MVFWPMLRVIRIKNYSALSPLPAAVICNSICLENLYIEGWDPLMSFARSQLPPGLKRLEIRSCKNFQCLLNDGERRSHLPWHKSRISIHPILYISTFTIVRHSCPCHQEVSYLQHLSTSRLKTVQSFPCCQEASYQQGLNTFQLRTVQCWS